MSPAPAASILADRGVLAVDGPDAVPFLQGLVSNDVRKAAPDRALHAAFLTAQGRYLHDFFILADGGRLLLDCEGPRIADLLRRLKPYRLRSRVTLADDSSAWTVATAFGKGVSKLFGLPETAGAAAVWRGGIASVDPRLTAAGVRLLLPRGTAEGHLREMGLPIVEIAAWDEWRIALGLADGSRDMEIEKALLLECGFDAWGSIDWQKGCWLGQELTARTRYRGLVKKRLVPVAVEGPLPPPGTAVLIDGDDGGEIRSGAAGIALALLRLDGLARIEAGAAATAAGGRVMPHKPDWATN